jgi:hypothetical protein
MIAFPEFHRESTLELPVIAAISGIAAGIILPWSSLLGCIVLIPSLLITLSWVWNSTRNTIIRYQWSRRYPRRMSCWQLRKQLRAKPKNVVVHIRYYGGFDVKRLCHAAVLEDHQTGELTAIYPTSWQIPQWCEQCDVPLLNA